MDMKNLEKIVLYADIEKPEELKEMNDKDGQVTHYILPVKEQEERKKLAGLTNSYLQKIDEAYSNKDFVPLVTPGEKEGDESVFSFIANPAYKEHINSFLGLHGYAVRKYVNPEVLVDK